MDECWGRQIQRHVPILGMLVNLICTRPSPSCSNDSKIQTIYKHSRTFLGQRDGEYKRSWKKRNDVSQFFSGRNEEDQKGLEVGEQGTKLMFGLERGERGLRTQCQHNSEMDRDGKRGGQVKRKMAVG